MRLDAHIKAAVDPDLPEALISGECLERIHRVAGHFPSGISEFFGFECRLGETTAAADFLFCAKAEFGGRDVLAGLASDDIPAALLEHPVWKSVRQFAIRWSEPESSLHDAIQNVWLEFDTASPEFGAPIPSLFFGTDAIRAGDAASGARAISLLGESLTLLTGDAVSRGTSDRLRLCIAALPEGAFVFQVGAMLARGTPLVRLCIRGLSAVGAAGLLEHVGWKGPMTELRPELDDAFARSESVDLDIDVAEEVSTKLGFECSFGDGRPGDERLRAFMERLVARGLSTQMKSEGVLSWRRAFHERANPEAWPADLRSEARRRGPDTMSMILRWPYHVKLVYEPGGIQAAKVYLAVKQAWPTPEILRRMAGGSVPKTEEVGA